MKTINGKVKRFEAMNNKKNLREIAIKNAINTWERMKAGEDLPHMGDLKRSPEYCEKQIIYFKNLKP